MAFLVFEAMATQWRVGVVGATGLDYAALPAVYQSVGCKRPDQPEVFEKIRVMELAALEVIRK
jgi:hypothetical protein